jgi:hypothetical protein
MSNPSNGLRLPTLLTLPLLAACTTSVVAVPSVANHAYVVVASGPSSAMYHCTVEAGAPLCARVQEKGGAK